MASGLFIVVLDDPDDKKAFDQLDKTYGDEFLRLNDGAGLIRAEGTSTDVAAAARIKGKDRNVDGVVFALGKSYAGYTFATTLKWLAESKKSE